MVNNGSEGLNVFNVGGLWNGNLPKRVLLQAVLCSLLCTGALGCSLEIGHCIVCSSAGCKGCIFLGRELSTVVAHHEGEFIPRDALSNRESVFLQLI